MSYSYEVGSVLSYDASMGLGNVPSNSKYKEIIIIRSQSTDTMYCTRADSKTVAEGELQQLKYS
jgi:hypothetical protein